MTGQWSLTIVTGLVTCAQKAPDNIVQEQILCSVVLMLLGQQHCTGKCLCNTVLKVQDNIAEEKILFNVVLILLGQHCMGEKLVQCCPRDRQHCTGK